mgnify:CR=1 FL=1
MAHAGFLRVQIPGVLDVGFDLHRHPVGDFQIVAFQPHDLAGIVGHQTHAAHAQIPQDLRSDAVVPQVRREAQLLVGLDRVPTRLLQLVGEDLVGETDAAAGDAVVAKVCETMKGDRQKQRVTFYYLVAREMGKLGEL